MPRYTPARMSEIRGHLKELEHGDLSVAELANEVGVSPWTIYCWKRRFAAASDGDRTRRGPRSRADLVEVEPPPASELIEIIIGPMTIRVPGTCDPMELRRVLEVACTC